MKSLSDTDAPYSGARAFPVSIGTFGARRTSFREGKFTIWIIRARRIISTMKITPARDPVELVVSEKHARLLYQLLPAFFAAFVLNLFLQIPDKLHSRTSIEQY
jgi:hypothetical protein